MAVMVSGAGGKVYGIDCVPALVELSRANISKHHQSLFDDGVLDVQLGDGYAGLVDAAPFDAIHVGAAAPMIPAALIAQVSPVLRPGTYVLDL